MRCRDRLHGMGHGDGVAGPKCAASWRWLVARPLVCGHTDGRVLCVSYVFVWVAYKEQSWTARGAWLVAILLLGNFAMSGYVLWQLLKIKVFSWEALLLRRDSRFVN